MGFLSHIIQSVASASSTVANAGKTGSVFGNSYYGKLLNNVTGVRTSANLIARARQRQVVGTGDVIADAGVMRPGQAYTQAQGDVASEAQAAQDAVTAGQNAMYQKQADAEATRARLQNEVRIRRTRMSEMPSTKGGTVLTGALGLPGTGTAARLLGA